MKVPIKGIDDRTLAKIWCDFHLWGWSKHFPIPKPAGWDDLDRQTRMAYITQICDYICHAVGERTVLREWNRGEPIDFDQWWDEYRPLEIPDMTS